MMRLLGLLLLLATAPPAAGPELLQAARDALAGQRYDEALTLYDRLREQYPQEAGIPYNMGVAAYRAGDLARAAELFDEARALAADPALRARSAYNLGTTAYRKSLEQPQDPAQAATQLQDATADLEAALKHFRDAIDADPMDADAKANGELAYRWLKQLQDMQQQMQQQQQDQEQQQQQQEQQQQQQQEQQQEDEQQQAAAAEQEQEEQAAQDEREQESERKPMSKEEAQRLLQQVRDKERRRQEELARREAGGQPPVDKDW